MPTLSYDLHVHPAPSRAPRWGDGNRVCAAAAEAGVHGFVWKAHEEHTIYRCKALDPVAVRVFGSASLNAWAAPEDILAALDAGADWLWGPTLGANGEIGWELPLPDYWDQLEAALGSFGRPLVIATGHLGSSGRRAFAELGKRNRLLFVSITHSLYVPLDEARELARRGCAFEIDAFTYLFDVNPSSRTEPSALIQMLADERALAYFTSDGGQAETGNPFSFGARALDSLGQSIGSEHVESLGVDNPALVVRHLDRAAGS